MRLLILVFMAAVFTYSCRHSQHDVETQTVEIIDTVYKEEPNFDDQQKLARQYIETLYDKVQVLDTTFTIKGLTYSLLCRHFCKKDNVLTVPAKYNFDTKKDFKTYNFATDLTLILGKDTLLRKTVEKSDFSNNLETALDKYATLLFPNISLKNDTISVNYSISIPGTDVGNSLSFRVAKDGYYKVNGM